MMIASTPLFDSIVILWSCLVCHSTVKAFEIVSITDISSWIATASPVAAAATTAAKVGGLNPMNLYMNTLTDHPLSTKMATGAVLAVTGDAIAQAKAGSSEHGYDKRRAASFMVFDMSYRALQHVLYPPIVLHFQGQYICTIVSLLFLQYYLPLDVAAAFERTFTSQLVIVPFLYYPIFFALSGFVQQLTLEEAVNRAQERFSPLMQRNLLFWIPVQYIQFSFVPEDLQIPFVSVAGLFWTIILSVMAGSTTTTQQSPKSTDLPVEQDVAIEEVYCVTGMEDECVLPEDLFPNASFQGVRAELAHDIQEVKDVLSLEIEDISFVITNELEEITHIFDDNGDDDENANGYNYRDQPDLEGIESEDKEQVL